MSGTVILSTDPPLGRSCRRLSCGPYQPGAGGLLGARGRRGASPHAAEDASLRRHNHPACGGHPAHADPAL